MLGLALNTVNIDYDLLASEASLNSADEFPQVRGLLVAVTIGFGLDVGMVAAILFRVSGDTDMAGAVRGGGIGFAGAVTTLILIMKALGLFPDGGGNHSRDAARSSVGGASAIRGQVNTKILLHASGMGMAGTIGWGGTGFMIASALVIWIMNLLGFFESGGGTPPPGAGSAGLDATTP